VAVFETGKVIESIKFTAGNKNDTLNVYGSTDGENWTLVKGEPITAAYGNHTVEMGANTGYKYIKLDVAGSNQVRLTSITIVYAD